MIPVGMLVAGIGVGLVAFTSEYLLTWAVIALSGLGISAYHPEAARAARQASGNSKWAMSVFALGGNAGFALGALATTPLLLLTGLGGTPLLIVRLRTVLDGAEGVKRPAPQVKGHDDWPAFLRLTAVVVVRSIVFFGAVGTLAGGWVADRLGRPRTIRIGFFATVPALLGLAVTVGGLFSPLLGWIADNSDLRTVFAILIGFVMLALLLAFLLREPSSGPRHPGPAGNATAEAADEGAF